MTHNHKTLVVLFGIVMLGLVFAAACAAPAVTPAPSQPPPAAIGAPADELPLADYPAPQLTEAPPIEPHPVGEVQTDKDIEKGCCPPPTPPYPTVAPAATPWPDRPYPEYDVKPFVDTRYDHLSTFAMDVDTASYSKMREYINSNRLPPIDLVRVEEFINYFNMEYPDPESGAFSINLEGGPSPFAEDGAYLLEVGIQGRHIPIGAQGQRYIVIQKRFEGIGIFTSLSADAFFGKAAVVDGVIGLHGGDNAELGETFIILGVHMLGVFDAEAAVARAVGFNDLGEHVEKIGVGFIADGMDG